MPLYSARLLTLCFMHACRLGSPRYFSTFAAEGVHHTMRSLAGASNKRNVSLSVILDAQLKRLHDWQKRASVTPTAAPTVGPFVSLAASDFKWLSDLCPLGRLEHAWARLQVGPLLGAKRASWIRFPPAKAGLNDRILRLNSLLWNNDRTEALLVVGILRATDDFQQTFIACVPCYRLVTGPAATVFPSVLFLSAADRVVLQPLEQCVLLSIGLVTPVFWSKRILLPIETGLSVSNNEDGAFDNS